MITGLSLQLSGFVPNVPQAMPVRLTIGGLFALLPFFGLLAASIMVGSFELNEEATNAMRAELKERRSHHGSDVIDRAQVAISGQMTADRQEFAGELTDENRCRIKQDSHSRALLL